MAADKVNIQMRLNSVNEVSFMMSPGKLGDNIKPDDILVQTAGFGKALNSATQYAETIVFSNVTSIGSTLRYNPNLNLTETYVQYIEFRTADDSSLNDGSFFFQISNMSDLDWL